MSNESAPTGKAMPDERAHAIDRIILQFNLSNLIYPHGLGGVLTDNSTARRALEAAFDAGRSSKGKEATPLSEGRTPPQTTITQTEGDSWPLVCPACKSANKSDRGTIYKGWGDTTYLRNYYTCYHPWHFDKWQTGRESLMEKELSEVPPTGQPVTSDFEKLFDEEVGAFASSFAGYLNEESLFVAKTIALNMFNSWAAAPTGQSKEKP